MAFVTVRNGSVVSRNAKGFTLCEAYTAPNGDERKTYYKVWTEETVPDSGIEVSGILSVRLSEYEGESRVEIHINKPRIKVVDVVENTSMNVFATRPANAYGNPLPVASDDAPF